MFVSPALTITARKEHTCMWCYEPIKPGEKYLRWMCVDDVMMTNKMHPECHQALCDADDGYSWEYTPGEGAGERPKL